MNNKIDNRITETYLVILITFFRQLFVYFFSQSTGRVNMRSLFIKETKNAEITAKVR